MNIVTQNKDMVNVVRKLVESLRGELYTRPLDLLSGATIGQHVRHILEFYICLLRTKNAGDVCYDSRDRSTKIELDKHFASVVAQNIISLLDEIKSDSPLKLRGNFSNNSGDEVVLDTSLFRELAYTLEHSVHHLALIKIALIHLSEDGIISMDFGVAPSTLRYRNVIL